MKSGFLPQFCEKSGLTRRSRNQTGKPRIRRGAAENAEEDAEKAVTPKATTEKPDRRPSGTEEAEVVEKKSKPEVAEAEKLPLEQAGRGL